jgi:membrane protein implicated in regulation of membrane protease activity
MNWADFYLICFAVGFVFSFLSFILGGFDFHLPFHIHVHFGGDGGHVHTGGHAAGTDAAHSGGHGGDRGATVSPFNPMTVAVFLAWFGGTGYLLTRFSGIWFVMGLVLAGAAGLVGAGLIFLFLSRVLTSREEDMDPADYEMVGVLGKISNPIREGGTGEIIYSQAGSRRSCGARSENGTTVDKGIEVVVTRYEKGIAYVRRWDELTNDEDSYQMDEPRKS